MPDAVEETRVWVRLDSPLGDLVAARTERGLRGVWFADHRGGFPTVLGTRTEPGADPVLDDLGGQLREYFAGARREFRLPLDPVGSPFELRVWAALREIPYGATRSYGDLARELGGIGHAQAVGAANGRNPLSIVVPCHRVVGTAGALTGYAGGLWRKRFLLSLEEPDAAEAARLF
ncbi:methylated-DNA--[protein]-cysteine S-methyltransferase [Kineococcus gynurae]|uniref:Methylated-DNA--protein-cysteine methyltransferase n=1 Tax=Kineococcus gynurae TaxID=452979 RepID=A0ABV5LWU6_9ACTN